MFASTYERYGSAEVLQIVKVDLPSVHSNEILVKVYAATVNRTDCAMLLAQPFIMRFLTGLFKPKKKILGTDFAGEVIEVGSEVKNFNVGDRIFGFDDMGVQSHAEFLKIKSSKAIGIIPSNISFDEAISCLEGAHYAINFINKVKIQPDDKVLINGATGAIGSALVQLLKARHTHITAVCNKEHFELVAKLGAHHTIDYKTEDFTSQNHTFDFIFDAVGKSSYSKCKPILKKRGIYISSEAGKYAQNLFYAIFTPFISTKKVVFPFPKNIQSSIDQIKRMIELNEFRAVIDMTYPLDEIQEAFSYVLEGQKIGNVVLQINKNTNNNKFGHL